MLVRPEHAAHPGLRTGGGVEHDSRAGLAVHEPAPVHVAEPRLAGEHREVVPHEAVNQRRHRREGRVVENLGFQKGLSQRIRRLQQPRVLRQERAAGHLTEQLIRHRRLGIEQHSRQVTRFQSAVVALDKIRAAANVNHNRKKIVQPADQRRSEFSGVFFLALGEETVGRDHLHVLVIASRHEYLFRVGELEAQQRVEHLDAVVATIRVIAEEHHVAVRLGQAEAVERARLVKRTEHGDE